MIVVLANGSITHEKYKPIIQTIPCSKCGVGYIYHRNPLIKQEDGSYKCKGCS